MNAARAVLPLILLSLTACAPGVPEPVLSEVPSAPLVHALEQRGRAFQSLKATASARAERRGRRLGLDNVGILIRSRDRLRIEAYGPLGQPLLEIAWDGIEVRLRQYGEPVPPRPGAGLERYLGADVEPGELCAVLTGNMPAAPDASGTRAFCGGNACSVELEQGDLVRRIRLSLPGGDVTGALPENYEVTRSGTLLFRVHYQQWETVSGYDFPRRVIIENPGRNAGLTVAYEEIELNSTLDDDVFTLDDRKVPDQW